MPIPPDALAAEFDAYMRRAGLTLPAERRTQVLAGVSPSCRDQVELLRNGRTAAVEPSNTFRLHRIAV